MWPTLSCPEVECLFQLLPLKNPVSLHLAKFKTRLVVLTPISTSGIRSDSQMILTREGQVTPVSYHLAVGQHMSGFLEFHVSSQAHNALH